jgi:hypothetical protein
MNPSTGPLAKQFDITQLYKRQVEISRTLCQKDVNPLLFPFWRDGGRSNEKDANSINAFLKNVFPFAPHATRDIRVMLCVASNLSVEQTQEYLLHSKQAETMKKYYIRFAQDYNSYTSVARRDEVFGYLTKNIKLNPIATQNVEKIHETMNSQGAAMISKGFSVDSNAYASVDIPKEFLDYASTSDATKKAVNRIALICRAVDPLEVLQCTEELLMGMDVVLAIFLDNIR